MSADSTTEFLNFVPNHASTKHRRRDINVMIRFVTNTEVQVYITYVMGGVELQIMLTLSAATR